MNHWLSSPLASLLLGLGMLGFAVNAVWTGKAFVGRGGGDVSRSDNPYVFWAFVGMYCLAAIFLLGDFLHKMLFPEHQSVLH